MIFAKLMGGLGNQMFQYAAVRAIAQARGLDFALDASYFSRQAGRTYRLGYLNIRERLATAEEVDQLAGASGSRLRRWFGEWGQRLRPYYKRRLVVERDYLHFDPHIFAVANNACLVGYWQNEKYFARVADQLKQEFTPRQPLSRQSTQTLREIETKGAIGVHVRRGDYVSDPKTRGLYVSCSVEYYQACTQRLLAVSPGATIYVFSDDPAWAKDHLKFEATQVVVDHNGPDRDFEDLYLLSRCQHFVIANSTFGWWGAWLAQNPDKIVYAPRHWFAVDTYDPSDFIPPSWRTA